jgi:hypothetical protein
MSQYPLEIYRPWFRRFFIFVIPLGCINYLPGVAILGRRSARHVPSAAVDGTAHGTVVPADLPANLEVRGEALSVYRELSGRHTVLWSPASSPRSLG